MSHEVMAYEKAWLDYSEAETALDELTATVKASGTALELDPFSVEVCAWPSSEQIASVPARVRSARQELRETWAAVPGAMRSNVEPPPEGVIRDDQAR